MTKNNSPNSKSVMIAAAAAAFVIIVSSTAYHVLAARLEGPISTTLLSTAELKRLPLEIGDWVGKEAPLDEEIVRATDTDAYLNRIYSRHNASEYVSLYIAYGGRARDLMPHRPEVCYTGAGWTLMDRSTMQLPLSGGMELPCNILQFSRGTLNKTKAIVLNYYIVDGQYCRDVSLLRSKAWRGSGTVRYVAQVQIVASTTSKIVCDFAVESALSIFELFESKEEELHSDRDLFDANNMFEGTGK